MIEENILRFITEANLGGIDAVNKALADQANRLRDIARQAVSNNKAVNDLTRSYRNQGNTLRQLRATQLGPQPAQGRNPLGQFMSKEATAAAYAAQLAQATNFRNRLRAILSNVGQVQLPNLLAGLQKQLQAAPGQIGAAVRNIAAQVLRNISFAGLARSMLDSAGAGARAIGSLLSSAAKTAGNAIRSFIVGALNAAQAAAGKLAGVLNGLKKLSAGIGIGGALAVFGGARAAAQVDQQLAVINTIARTTDPILDSIASGLTKISSITGTTFADLSAGFYDLLSAGLGFTDGVVNVALSLRLMEDASNLAVGGLGTVEQSLDLLTTLLNAFRGPLTTQFGDPLKASTVIADAFAKSVELGKVTIAEISEVISTAAPLSAQLGVTFQEIAAILAVMTQQGFTAGEAMTALRSAEVGVQRNSKALQTALTDPFVKSELGKIGAKGWLEYLDVAGFGQFATLLRKYSEASGVPLIKLLGRIEGVQAILGVTGAQAENYEYALAAVSDANGTAAEQAELLNDNLLTQIQLFKNALFATGDALFRRRLIDPLKDFVKQMRFTVIGITDFIGSNKALFDLITPLLIFVSGLAALTAGASAIETIFLRVGGPISGFAFGISSIARLLAAVLLPLGGAVVLFNALEVGIREGLLPAKQFQPVLDAIYEIFRNIAAIGGATAAAIQRIFDVIANPTAAPGGIIEHIFDDLSGIEFNVDAITRNVRALITRVTRIIFGEFGDSVGGQAAAIGGAILEGLQRGVEYVAPRVADTLGQLLTFGGEVLTNVVEFGARIIDGIVTGIIGALPDLAAAIEGIPAGLAELGTSEGANSIVETARQWGASFIGWWQENAGPLADGIGAVLKSVAKVVAIEAPRLLGAIFDFVGDVVSNAVDLIEQHGPRLIEEVGVFVGLVGPQILDFVGEVANNVVGALEDLVATMAPPLAAATGALIDWIAAAIPSVFGAVARFIDEVVRNLVPLGQDDGAIGGAMGDVGGQLVKWITDRIPDALGALAAWAGQVEGWILTVLFPRIAAVFLGLGATLVKALFDGLVTAITHPGETLGVLVNGVELLLGAAAIIGAAKLAGAAIGIAYATAVGAAVAAFRYGATFLATFAQALLGQAVAAGTAAGLGASAAMIAAFALPITAVVLVTIKVVSEAEEQKESIRRQVTEMASSASIEALRAARDAVKAQLDAYRNDPLYGPKDVLFGLDKFYREQIESFNAAIKGLIAQGGIDAEIPVNITPAPIRDPKWDQFHHSFDPIKIALSSLVTDFETGTQAIVDDFNSIPDRLQTGTERLTAALENPFDLDGALAQFRSGYQLILTAQQSGNVSAIVEANNLRTAMVEQANTINAAFIAAGQAAPLLVDAITGQVTLAGAETGSLANEITTALDPVTPAFQEASKAPSLIVAELREQRVTAAEQASGLADDVVAPFKPANFTQLAAWGFDIISAWVGGIVSGIGSAPERISGALGHAFGTGPLEGDSPPRVGPLSSIDQWGFNIGVAWVDGLVLGLQSGPDRVASAVRSVSASLLNGVPSPNVALSYASGAGSVPGNTLVNREQQTALTFARAEALLEQQLAESALQSRLLARVAARGERGDDELLAEGILAPLKKAV